MVDSDGSLVSLTLPPVADPIMNIKKGKLGGANIPLKFDNKPEKNIMAIRLLINPTTLTSNMAKIINRTQTMTGWVEDHWGEELDTITCQGSTASFVLGSNPLRPTSDMIDRDTARSEFYSSVGVDDYTYMMTGLTATYRRNTVSYEQFKKVVDIFQANGCMFDTQGFVRQRNYVQLSYDYSKYKGYFEAFDITEDARNPFRFIYTLTFKSEKTLYSFNKVLWQNQK
jgi:hypothetical protein